MDKMFIKSETALIQTLEESDLAEIGINIGEIAIDSIIDDGLLKNIPIISAIVGLVKTTSSISNVLFLKKVAYFLRGIKDVSPKKRYEMIGAINNSSKYKMKVGERLLYILNRCDDHDKASLIAELFKAFLNKDIEYDEFLRGSSIINSIYIEDFTWFLELNEKDINIEEELMPFISYGLCNVLIEMPELIYTGLGDWDDGPEEYKLSKSGTNIIISDIGEKLRSVFNRTS